MIALLYVKECVNFEVHTFRILYDILRKNVIMLKIVGLIIRTEEKFDEIKHGSSTKGIQVFALLVPQIRVPLIIEHFVGSQIHTRM